MGAEIGVIRAALKRYRAISRSLRYGGLWKDYELAKQALDALDRLEKPVQPRLFEVESRPDQGCPRRSEEVQ